jgi:UDP-galactopyranose mutase
MKKAIILGAGFAGCTFVYLLRQMGWEITIIEKSKYVGGGCRTFFHGGHPFTYGPRHFISKSKKAYDFLNQITPLRDLQKINIAYIEEDRKFYTYPVHEDDIDLMPEKENIKKELQERPPEFSAKNYEEYWISQVGETLYRKFNKEFNRKAWFLESNTEMDSGFEGTVKARTIESGDRYEFKGYYNCYPVDYNGYNAYFENASQGCKLFLNTSIDKINLKEKAVFAGNEKLKGDIIISSIALDHLLEYQFGELKYIGRDFFQIILPVEHVLPENVSFAYYPNASELHTRVVEYKKLTLYNSPHSLISLEVPSLKNKLYPFLTKAEIAKHQRYRDLLPDDIIPVGRMGLFRYNNMSEIILSAMEITSQL